MKPLLRLLLLAALAYAGVCLLLVLTRNRVIFPLRGGTTGDPRDFGFPDGERVSVPTADGERLAAWFLPAPAAAGKAGAVVWFHGNAETVAALAPLLREFRPERAAMLVIDYRGLGESSGAPSVAGLTRDAEAAWEWLANRADVDAARVVVYGRSVGTGPAVHLAANRPVAGLMLESAFTSLRGMARAHFAIFPPFIAPAGFDNLAAIGRVRAPVLLIHGDADGTIPPAMSRALAERLAGRAELWVIPGADHNDTSDTGGDEYARRFKEFVSRVAP